MADFLVGLDGLGRSSVSQAGGKGALLGELMSRGLPVPRGYCLLTSAYDSFLEVSGLVEAVRAAHTLAPGPEAETASAEIHDRIEEAPIPPEVAVALSTLYRSLGQRPRVAIRPSPAYDEELRNPVARQIPPHLNVLGEKDLFQSVRDTWASIWRPEIITLCHRRGIDHARLKPAVIMQVMIHPASSGTIFTADPVTGERDRLLITASWGMGQGSLGGQTTPDTYHVDRETRTLRFKKIVTKEVMVSASGIVPVPKNRRNSVVLKDPAILELCEMAIGVEEVIQTPAEIEWCAVANGQLRVLEALPIGESTDLVDEEIEGSEPAPAAAREPSGEHQAAAAAPAPETANGATGAEANGGPETFDQG